MLKISADKDRINGLTLFELAIALAAIFIFVGVLFIFIQRAAFKAKETTLRTELQNIRQSLVLYRAIKGRPPEDLRTLLNARFKPRGTDEVFFDREFLDMIGRDKDGYPVDSFGSRFYYDTGRGVVYSGTAGYKDW